jgi:ABC-type branched-subunit amino acid transport system substrate-binding protein
MSLAVGGQAMAQDAYDIGALFPLSGHTAAFGEMYRSATSLAVEHINADKFLDKPLTVTFEDSQAQAQTAVVAMNKLVRVAQVPVVLTGFSAVSKAIAPLGERDEVLVINGGASSPDLAGLSPYFYNVIPLANDEVKTLLPYLAEEMGARKIALVYVDDPLGQAVVETLGEDAPKNGMELAGSFAISSSTSQFASIAARVRQTGADAVFLAYFGQQLISLAKQLRDAGVEVPFVGISTIGDPNFIADPAGEGTIYVSQKTDWGADDALTRRFVDGYREQFGKEPTPYDANYYNATMIVAKVIDELESDGLEVTGKAIRDKLAEIRSFRVVGGELEFHDDGTVTVPSQINLIENRAVRVVQ